MAKAKVKTAAKSKEDIKAEAREAAIRAIETQFGKGSAMMLDSKDAPIVDVPVISTGSLYINKALGVGGLPRGRIVEIVGPESSGKTTLALHIIAEAQKLGGTAAFIDAEHALDKNYAKKLGVDTFNVLISQPGSGEQALEITETLVKSGGYDIIVIDSVAALVPQAELDGEMGDSVIPETPVYIRKKSDHCVDIVPVCDLFKGAQKMYPGHHTSWYRKFNEIEILTHSGWKNINGVVKKENYQDKEVVATRIMDGYIATTRDHCLFQNEKEVSVNELEVFDRIDTVSHDLIEGTNIKRLISEDVAWLLGFWVAEGSHLRTNNCNWFEICNTDRKLISECEKILTKNFMTQYNVRTVDNYDNTRKPLHVLNASSCKELGFLLQQCVCEKIKIKKIPKLILNAIPDIKIAFLNGFFEGDGSHSNKDKSLNYYNSSFPVIAGLQFILKSIGKKTGISCHSQRPGQLMLREINGKRIKKDNEIANFSTIPHQPILYDISTDSGTFVTAIGNIVVHNSHMGLQARLMSQAMRKLSGVTSKSKCIIVFINQIREKIGVVFGPTETSPGGRALKFYASVRMDIRRTGVYPKASKGHEILGNATKVKVVKNKLAPPFREAHFVLRFGHGIDTELEMVSLALEYGIIVKSGSWYSLGEERIGQGAESVRMTLLEDKEFYNKVWKAIKEHKQ